MLGILTCECSDVQTKGRVAALIFWIETLQAERTCIAIPGALPENQTSAIARHCFAASMNLSPGESMTRKTRFAVVVLSALLLSACQTVPPLSFSVPNVGVSKKKLDAEVKSITVTLARADEKTGDLPAATEVLVPQTWQTALTEALNRMAIFQDDAPTKVSISVKILKLAVPAGGFSFTTQAAARYEIIDRKTGAIIFTQDIEASGTTPADYAFAGHVRARESINRAVQNNITQFLQALETVNLSKPMFPVKR